MIFIFGVAPAALSLLNIVPPPLLPAVAAAALIAGLF